MAIIRRLSSSITRCELTHMERTPIDFDRACAQHAAYVRTLRELGCRVIELPAEPDLPDAVFVEDCAVVLDELGVIARPGAASRRGEVRSIELTLEPHRRLARIESPATLDGGDCLVIGRRLFVGTSTRTNEEAIGQLRAILGPNDYRVDTAPVRCCLHLKSACTALDERTMLINRDWTDASCFDAYELIDVDPAEPHAANVVSVNGAILAPAHAPRTIARLRARGYDVIATECDELARAEGGLTCCCLLVG